MIDWLCSSLGLPLVAENEVGGLRLNAAAQKLLGDTASAASHATLESALRPLAAEAAASLGSHVRRARLGDRSELHLAQGTRVLFLPVGAGRAAAIIVPHATSEHAALQRRAEATDRSARVSHELANALGAIAGWARLAREGTHVDEALDLIEKSADTAWSAARTVLGEVSGQLAPDDTAAVIDLSSFVEEAARLLMPKALKKNVSVRTSITPGLCVAGDRGSAWSIVWNLATNAVEALPSGGSVTFQLTATCDLVHLCISDDGPGMSDEVRARVFEPYFTTKSTGSGIGLSVVEQTVKELGGRIELDTAPGRGTRFQIDLPRARSSERPRSRGQTTGKRSSGVFVAEHLEGRFLVIDDDPALRGMVATALEMRGAEVVSVATLEEARAARGPWKLVLVDLMLGEQRGDSALADLRAAGQASAAVLMTGTEIPRRLVAGGEPDAVLRKPFELSDLYECVIDVLSRRRDAKTAAR